MNKTQKTKSTKLLKVIGVISITILVLAVFGFYSKITDSTSRQYERAKQSCNSELWIVQRDAVFYDVRQIQRPYPKEVKDLSGEEVIDFACNQHDAEDKRQAARLTDTAGYYIVFGILILGPLIPIVVILLSVKKSRQRGAKAKK